MSAMLPKRGRPGASLLMSVERELDAQDILNLAISPGPITGAPIIQKLRASHHAAARAVAEGKTHIEVALLTGYTAQRISDLARNDPAFQGLVAFYQDQISVINVDDAQKAQLQYKDMMEAANEEIIRRLDDENEVKRIPIGELRQISALGADRTVAPPRTAVAPTPQIPTITFNIGTRELKPGTVIDNDATNATTSAIEPISETSDEKTS